MYNLLYGHKDEEDCYLMGDRICFLEKVTSKEKSYISLVRGNYGKKIG